MTTLSHYREVDVILQRLEAVRQRRRAVRLATVAMSSAVLLLSAVLVVSVAAGYWPDQPPAALRWALLALLCLAAGMAAARVIVTAAFRRQNLAQTARFVERAVPDVRNDLINSVLLAGDRQQASPELVSLAIAEAAERSGKVDLSASVSLRAAGRWALAAGAAVVLLAAFAAAQFGPMRRGLLAVLAPRAYVPAINRIELVSLSPEDGATLFAGQELTIVAKVRNDAGRELAGQVLVEGDPSPQPMLASEAYSTFSLPLGRVDQGLRFAVKVGDSRWPADKPYYQVNVIQRVEVKGLDLAYEYPIYTGLKARTQENSDGNIEAPAGSRVTVALRVSARLPAAHLDLQGASPAAMTASSDGLRYTAILPVIADGAYRLLLLDPRGRVMQQLPDANGDRPGESYGRGGQTLLKGYFRIRAMPDEPPKVTFLSPARDTSAPPGGKLPLKVRLFDRYGLSDARLYVGLEGQEPRPVDGFAPADLAARGEHTVDFALDLAPYKKGDVVVYHAAANDNRPADFGGPQTAVSDRFKVVVQDAAELAAEKARRYEELRRRLMELLKLEETQRVNCEICIRKHDDLAGGAKGAAELGKQVVALAREMLDAQRRIKAGLTDLAEKFPYDEDTGKLQGEIASLASGNAALAVQQADTLAGMSLQDRMGRQGAQLAETQDRIIDALQTLLAIMPSVAGRKGPAERAASRPTELTPEARDKLVALRSDLEKFAAEQRKIIEASDRLAKKPVDNFTEEDEKVLQDLKALQDKWEKFLNEAFADFSKLAEQDFSNPVLLKELISVKSDITMAKDALSKKAVEIATALEDNGIENAETLTANIEKWLPDKPDREKWAMEDPGEGQMNVEQADLPKELEDLVGDLLEEEEDLFDEMQDLTGKYNMSGDKGIGWDATDGPISNMNAQGVTGNQLPNANELSGRSGEGRQGKSSGEFVEDKYVGKGGRRTPTRLSPDPYQKGEVKDESSEPAGGATGGGKVGGAGGEGLEGPVPPPMAKEMKRLAGQQAALLNKAERISGRFQTDEAANVRLLEAVTLMNRVRKDLEAYRYANVLRSRKEVLGALSQSKMLLAGEIDVEKDPSAAMPKYIMDDIADAMKGRLPEEYREVLQQYYRRLSEQGAE